MSSRPPLPRNVWVLGFVSLFMDLSSEIYHALLPAFITIVLGLPATALGAIDGIAEATANFAKLLSGRLSDRSHAQRTTGIGLGILLAAWLQIALLPLSLWGLVAGVVAFDFGLQSVHVSNQSLIYRVRPEAQSRLTAGYMLSYSIGSATGAIASTAIYARAGWTGVSLLGAAIALAALLFWAFTRHEGAKV